MFRNCVVRCIGVHSGEHLFTVGRTYTVVNDRITDDFGNEWTRAWNNSVLDRLSRWFQFELVTDTESIPIVRCNECGRVVLENEIESINDYCVCPECVTRVFRECSCCGSVVHVYDMRTTVDGEMICEDCSYDYYIECAECGDLIHESNAMWDDDSEEHLCPACYDERVNCVIQRYGYKPTPIFYGNTGDIPMGVELEIDGAGEYHDNARILSDIVNDTDEHIYFKHDGSIDNGFEIVSHPATLDYHTNNIAWADMMRKAVSMGYRSHDTDTCGLHVHVSRMALGDTLEEQDETISKIVYFIENNWTNVLRFTRRTESNLRRWASRYGIENDIPTTYKKAKGDYNRYRCINLQNAHTIEFRIFRGTLKHDTFIATLQLVHDICTICKNASMEDVEKMDWRGFVSRIDTEKRSKLIEYLNIRGLNV